MSARTSTNLEFRDNSGALIAFIDNGGNLKLKKTMNVNYAKALDLSLSVAKLFIIIPALKTKSFISKTFLLSYW